MPLDLLLTACALIAGANLALLLVVLVRTGRQRALADRLDARLVGIEHASERGAREVRDELSRGRQEQAQQGSALRGELGEALSAHGASVRDVVTGLATITQDQLQSVQSTIQALTTANDERIGALSAANEQRLDQLRVTLESRLDALQRDTAGKLELMRATVEEKLQSTLERRLGESFRQVSDRLEQVHRGLGEMQALAAGVGDLKRVLTNVKARGTWGEVQLGSLLEQGLAPEQFAANVPTRDGSSERVEFVIKLPGRDEEAPALLLPIDAKFPLEDYQRLVEAAEAGDVAAHDAAAQALDLRLRTAARDIRDKYINPPRTTDFAILFLPTEGLHAEVLRRTALVERLQQEFRVAVAGPTTLWAFITSLQMGFRTLAIQRRSGEVWELLGRVKADFARFGDSLAAVQKKLHEASSKIDEAQKGTRRIQRTLSDVQELRAGEDHAPAVLPLLPHAGDSGED
jgi:DNA recombination protein RmuC